MWKFILADNIEITFTCENVWLIKGLKLQGLSVCFFKISLRKKNNSYMNIWHTKYSKLYKSVILVNPYFTDEETQGIEGFWG